MTPSEIAALGDRELDALVAEKVMGWKPMFTLEYDFWVRANGEPAGHELGSWHPSTDPRAMMEVVGRMQGLGYRDVQFSWEGDKYNAFFANYPGNASNQKSGSALHEKLPRAVAEAALLAVLSGEGE